MVWRGVFLGLLGAVLASNLAVDQANGGERKETGAALEGRPVGGWQLSLKFAKTTFTPDETIVCTVTLANVSAQDKVLTEARELDLYEFKVLLPDGKEAPLTLRGRTLLAKPVQGSMGLSPLKAGDSCCFTVSRLNEMYDMSLSGEYAVSVSRSIGREGGAVDTPSSNVVRIRIEAPLGYMVVTSDKEPYLPPAIEGMMTAEWLAVLERVKNDRADLEKDLLRRLHTAKLNTERLEQQKDPVGRLEAAQALHVQSALIFVLGLYRLEGAAKDLSEMIGFEPKPARMATDPPWGRYPAVDALIRIGGPAVPLMLENIQSSDSKSIRELSGRVLFGIEGAENSTAILEKALQSQTDKRKQESLQDALRIVRENKQ